MDLMIVDGNVNSKYRNKSSGRFGKEIKNKYSNTNGPGPGYYDFTKTSFSPDGKYFYSKLKNAINNKFGVAERVTMKIKGQSMMDII
jgi:hypothetical protein